MLSAVSIAATLFIVGLRAKWIDAPAITSTLDHIGSHHVCSDIHSFLGAATLPTMRIIDTIAVLILLQAQCMRRAMECMSLHVFASNSTIHIIHYLIGLSFYIMICATTLIEPGWLAVAFGSIISQGWMCVHSFIHSFIHISKCEFIDINPCIHVCI